MFDDYFNGDQVYWYLTRSAGIMTWLSACGSVFVGLIMGSKMFGRRPGQPWLLDLHRYLSLMTIVFMAGHVLTLWADNFVEFELRELFVPGTGIPNYSTLGVSLGVISGWLILVVQLTSLVRNYFPARFWHLIHLSSFIVVFMGAYHGFNVGSEADNILILSLGATLLTAVVIGTVARIIGSRQAKQYKEYRSETLQTAKHKVLTDAAPKDTESKEVLQDR